MVTLPESYERRVSAVNTADWLVETHSGGEAEIKRLSDLFLFF